MGSPGRKLKGRSQGLSPNPLCFWLESPFGLIHLPKFPQLAGVSAVLYLLHSPSSHCPAHHGCSSAGWPLLYSMPFGWSHNLNSENSISSLSFPAEGFLDISWLPYLLGFQSLCIKFLVLNRCQYCFSVQTLGNLTQMWLSFFSFSSSLSSFLLLQFFIFSCL